jgi:energy-coupling factor transport system ATP-binding protein
MIAVQGLTYRYRGRQAWVLQDVNLDMSENEFVVINGPSGCGKSTLALALGGYLFHQYDGEARGSVTVSGMDVRQCPIYDTAEVVGLVQQNPEAQFCTLTVQDEVAFGLENRRLPPHEIEHRIAWALDVVGARHLLHRPLAALSGGEKQKVAIAAVMAAKPKVLILDEPTSNLDPTATAEVLRVIAGIRAQAGLTVLIVEHKLTYLRPLAPRLVTLEQGRVVYDGPLLEAHCPRLQPIDPSARCAVTPPTVRAEPLVRVEDIWIHYDQTPVLRGISLEVHPGDFLAVMGDNGSGKTTLLHSLLGLLKPIAGQVTVLGGDTRRVPVSQMARRVGYVFQNPDHQLFGESVWDEATYALQNWDMLDEEARSQTQALLERCGLGDRGQDHPYRLSYGEKRRLNLVSVLSYSPQLVLLDEVLIGQDPANAQFLLGLLHEHAARGNAVIMVNHNPDVTRAYASRTIFLRQGSVLVDAPTGDAFQELAFLGLEAYLPIVGVD